MTYNVFGGTLNLAQPNPQNFLQYYLCDWSVKLLNSKLFCLWMFMSHRCSSGEERLNIPEGALKKIAKTTEQKEKELEVVMHSESYVHWSDGAVRPISS